MEEKDQEVISLYLKGVSVKNIKKMTECGDVYKILKRNNIKTNRRLSEELKDAVVADYLAGVTTREIAKKHKTRELYKILNERGIEYKQDNDKQKERYKQVVDLYLNNIPIDEIVQKTGYKDVYKILKKFNIPRNRDRKEYKKNYFNELEKRNKKIIDDYLSGKYSTNDLMEKYNMTMRNIYKILKSYGIKSIHNKTHHWVIKQKVKNEPNTPGKFYVLEDYYGYTKIGITTKSSVKERFNKNVNVFYEINNSIKNCYDIEYKLKKILNPYIPQKIDRTIDGWSECYTLSPQEIIEILNTNII